MKRSDIPTKDVLIACHRFHKEGCDAPWVTLMSSFNAPEKVVYAAIERDVDKGYLDYGVSVRTAWVTPDGYDFLEKLTLQRP